MEMAPLWSVFTMACGGVGGFQKMFAARLRPGFDMHSYDRLGHSPRVNHVRLGKCAHNWCILEFPKGRNDAAYRQPHC